MSRVDVHRFSLCLFLGAALAASAPALPAAAPATPTPPSLRLPAGVAPVRYAVDWTIDPAKETFEGAIEIDLSVSRPTDVLWLNASELDIHSVRLTSGASSAPRSPARILPGGDHYAGFAFDPPVPAGPSKLAISYTAKVSPKDTTGVFRQKVGDDWYVYSQFEEIDARRAMPCFDEPSFKVPWKLTLRVPRGLTAVSNTLVESEREEGGRKVVVFRETRPLPSYLVAIGVGPFDVVDSGRVGANSIPVRFIVPRGYGSKTRYAQTIQAEMMRRLEAYFGIPFPYEKLDHLVIPHTVRFGAMENPGLITWTETFTLAKPEEETAGFKRLYTIVAQHEIAHQWFGDYVTLAWWDDTWLNESFATWISEKLTREWKPEWQRDVALVLDKSDTLARDTLKSTRQIRQPIRANGDIDSAFDDMSYGKGGAVLAMFERWIGPEKFRDGIRAYLSAHAWKNATSEDFLASLEKAGGPGVARALDTFLEQPGFPLVTAELACAPGAAPRLLLGQNRLMAVGESDPAALWRVPVCARWGGDTAGRACTLLADKRGELLLEGAPAGSCPAWALANEGEAGYYRAAYAEGLQRRLLAPGVSLTLAEQAGVLADVKALAALGRIPAEQALELVPTFAHRPERQLVVTAAEIAALPDEHWVTDALRPSYEAFLRDAFSESARRVSWKEKPGEGDDAQLLRPTLLRMAALRGRDPELRSEGVALGRRWLDDRTAADPNVAFLALEVAACDGDAALFDRMLSEAKKATETRDRRRILAALGAFTDPALERRALALTLDPAFDGRESIAILYVALADRRTRDTAWEFFRSNFDALFARLPNEARPTVPRVGAHFCDVARREQVRTFLEPRMKDVEGAERPLAQTLETIGQCESLSAVQRPSVDAFLKKTSLKTASR
jgi:alanyl aminopeptidase